MRSAGRYESPRKGPAIAGGLKVLKAASKAILAATSGRLPARTAAPKDDQA